MSIIQWTDETANPIVPKGGGWWCKHASPGCTFCYSEEKNQNPFFGGNQQRFGGQPPELILRRELLESWSRMRKPRRIFVGSMTDLFGEWVPLSWQLEILSAAAAAPHITFQLLTKRPEIARLAADRWLDKTGLEQLPPNIWVGCSVESQEWADRRHQHLQAARAAVRFVSYEPALGPVDWRGWEFLNWMVVGGESGPKARPADPLWFEQALAWCQRNDVAYFFKQGGSVLAKTWGTRHPKAGDLAEVPTHLQVRQFPNCVPLQTGAHPVPKPSLPRILPPLGNRPVY